MKTPQLSIILPVLNEADIIGPVVSLIEDVLKRHRIDYEIILVENESTDATWTVIRNMERKNKRIRAVATKRGYGSAVLCGIRNARGEYVSYMPSDGQIDPHILPRLWDIVREDTFDVVKIRRANRENILRWIQSKAFNLLAKILYGVSIDDINGSPRIVSRQNIRKLHLTSTDSFIDTEFIIKAQRLGWKIREIPMKDLPRAGGVSTVRFATVVEFLRNLFSYRHSGGFAMWKKTLLGIFLFLRLFHLNDWLNFGSDQGMHLLDIYSIYQNRLLTLIGPPSSFVVFGRSFFTGSFPYYFLLPILLISNWNPLSVSYFLIFLQFVSVWFVTCEIDKNYPGTNTGFFFLLLATFSTTCIHRSRYLWHPNFLIPVSLLVIALLFIRKRTRRPKTILFLIGLLCGIGLQFHYSYILAIIATAIWLIAHREENFGTIVSVLGGFVIGFLPIIVFELRHEFYNLQTVLLYVRFILLKGNSNAGIQTYYYLFPILPFLFLYFARLLHIIHKRFSFLTVSFFAVYIAFCLYSVLPTPAQGYTMADGWNYHGVQKTAAIIKNDHPTQYNVVDLLTGDTRALALRYLLTIDEATPMGVTEYPNAKTVYLYTRVPMDEIRSGTLWELNAVRPLQVVKQWDIQNGIMLYRLE